MMNDKYSDTSHGDNANENKYVAVKGFVQLALILCFITGSFAASIILKKMNATKSDPAPAHEERILYVQSQKIQQSDYRVTIDTSGVVTAGGSVEIIPEVSGRIIDISEQARTGGAFIAGEILFQIDPRDYQDALAQSKSSLAAARSALALEKAEVEAAIAEWKLFNGDKALPDLVARKPQLQEAKLAVASAKAAFESAQRDLDRAAFSLPYDGRIMQSDLAEGQFVSAGNSYGTLYTPSSLEIEISLDAQELSGLRASDEPKAFAGDTELTIKRVAAALDTETRFGTVTLGLNDDDNDHEAGTNDVLLSMPGQFIEVSLETNLIHDVYVLPTIAMQKNNSIWQIINGKTLKPFDYELIHKTGSVLAVRSLDTDGKDIEILTSQLSGAIDGMSVSSKGNSQ